MAFSAHDFPNLGDKIKNIPADTEAKVRTIPNLLRRSTHGLAALHSEIGATSRFGLPSREAQTSHTDPQTGCLVAG